MTGISSNSDARLAVEQLLNQAVAQRASDLHIEPTASGYDLKLRVDGLLQTQSKLPIAVGRSYVTRLMVLAQLLTYRQDIPQEGRLRLSLPSGPAADNDIDLRLAIMPTTHGMRAVVRLPAELVSQHALDTLGLPEPVLKLFYDFAKADSGMLLVTGPAGSGKTTSIYALLEHIAQLQPGLSLISLEDPVERDLPAVTQIEIQPHGELTFDRVLRSVLRQDPQVLMIGEIRDRQTASIAVQAALTGHRLIATMHAGTPAGAIARLLEMHLEPYQISSALYGVTSLRLLRKSDGQGSYKGRIPVGEAAYMDDTLRAQMRVVSDASQLAHAIAQQLTYRSMKDIAVDLVQAGVTDQQEIDRILGS